MKQYLNMKNYTIAMAVIFVSMVSVHYVTNLPKSVQITADKWKCNDTVPIGIEAHCTSYVELPIVTNEKLSMRTP